MMTGVLTLVMTAGALTLAMEAWTLTLAITTGALTLATVTGALTLVMMTGAMTIRILVRFKLFLLPEPLYSSVSVRVLSVGCVDTERYSECYSNPSLIELRV